MMPAERYERMAAEAEAFADRLSAEAQRWARAATRRLIEIGEWQPSERRGSTTAAEMVGALFGGYRVCLENAEAAHTSAEETRERARRYRHLAAGCRRVAA